MKRVLCLYRVSTKGQVDPKDDIPMQRRECQAFIDKMEDWVFFDERMEKGVSGYKVSTSKRDVIMEIRTMAEKKQFDVLLVFMFDRLGRREDETPFLVQWFIENGIEVWSTREGQQRLDNRVDKLLNFMRYWQAGGESEKTSMRVKAAHSQMTSDGVWRGGTRPYGYKLVHNGRIGKKNRPLYDLEIDEREGAIVREIFDKVAREGYGSLRLANELNRRKVDPNKIWTAQSIRTIVQNKMYTGRLHMNDITSQPIEALRIVSDSEFEFATYAIASRIPRRYNQQREAENASLPADASTKTSVYGATMLSGILYCAHCGHKLVGSYCTKQRGNGAYHRPIYRCYNGAVKAKKCGGQTVYSAAKIESAVLEVVNQYFSHITQSVDSVWREQARLQLRSRQNAKLREAKSAIERLQKQQAQLKQEVLKSIMGESGFETGLLNEMLRENKDALVAAESELRKCESEKENEDAKLQYLTEQYRNISDWAQEFADADADTRKMILARIIEKITVDRDYNLHFYFFVSEADFEQQMAESTDRISVEQAENQIQRVAN